MSLGKKKSTGYKSEFRGTKQAQSNLQGVGQGLAYKQNGTLYSNATLSPELQNLQNTFRTGSQANADVLAMSPAQRMAQIQAGANPYFNLSNEIANRELQNALNTNFQQMQERGLGNSTITGGIQGQLLNEAALRNQQLQLGALQNENALASGNFGTMFGGLGELINLQNVLAGNANANYFTAQAAADANKQFNENYQAANPKQGFNLGNSLGGAMGGASTGFMLGGPVGAVVGGLGGGIMGGFTGNTSQAVSPVSPSASGGQFGGIVSQLFNRFNQPTYPTVQNTLVPNQSGMFSNSLMNPTGWTGTGKSIFLGGMA